MKCDICGKELDHYGFVFEVRPEDHLNLCHYCNQYIVDLKSKANDAEVIQNANAYFSSIPEQSDNYYANSSISAARFTLNSVSIPLTLEYIRNHPDHDLSNHTLIIHETSAQPESYKEVKEMLEKLLDIQKEVQDSITVSNRQISGLISVEIVGVVLSSIGFITLIIALLK
jgi:hypothetical protein